MPALPIINNYSVQDIFLSRIKLATGTYSNSTGSTVTLTPGTVMGQIITSGNWLPCASGASDGSQNPRALCYDTYVVPTGTSVTFYYCYAGDVNQNGLVFQGTDTLATSVSTLGIYGSLLTANSLIVLWPSTELSGYDNGVGGTSG